jgi:Ca2+-binding RTX toxin-like protein
MKMRLLSRLAGIALVILALVGILSAAAAANQVASSHLTDQARAIPINDLKPPDCAAITLTNLVKCPTGSGSSCTGGNGNNGDLILGGPNGNNITGKNGSDCIVGGAGYNIIDGGPGNDVCIGNAGDSFSRCETEIRR